MFYRPEWTCGRYNSEYNVALMYNLMDGTSHFFEDLSAKIIGIILSFDRNQPINPHKLTCIPEIKADLKELELFLENLCMVGLLSKRILSETEVLSIRKRVSIRNKKYWEYSTNPLQEDLDESAEDLYNKALKGHGICSAIIELTYRCTEKCIHCYNPKAIKNDGEECVRDSAKELDLSEYEKLIDDLYNLGCYKVTLTGGDPFSRSIIWDLIKYLHKKGIAFDIYTNGLYLASHVEKLIKYYPKSVSISLYSGIDNIHEAITKVKGSYKRSLSTIKQLSEYGIPLIIKCCIMKTNATSYYLVNDIAKEYCAIPQFEVNLQDSLNGDRCVSKYLRLDGKLLDVVLRDQRTSLYVGKERKNYGASSRKATDKTCNAGETGICITPTGDIQPCVAFPLILGNIRESSIKDILTHSKLLRAWKGTLLKDFLECGKKEFCDFCVLCAGNNFVSNGTVLKPCKNNCSIALARYELAKKLEKGDDPLNGKTIFDRLADFNNTVQRSKRICESKG